MKTKRRNVLKVIIFALIAVFIIDLLGFALCFGFEGDAWSVSNLRLEDENTIDVCFVGSSEVMAGISPGLAYDEFGYTGFIYATTTQPMSLIKYELEEIRKTQNPDVFVIEICSAAYDSQDDETSLRKYIDQMPRSLNKTKAIYELQKDNYEDYLFCSLPKYHDRYSQAGGIIPAVKNKITTFQRGYSILKGGLINPNFRKKTLETLNTENDFSAEPLTKETEACLRSLLDYLKENNYDNVLFYRAPIGTNKDTYKEFQRINQAGKIIEEYGYPFINYANQIKKYGFDPYDDYYDLCHSNVFGQEKFTRIISKYITENYELTTDLTDEQKAEWDYCAEASKQCRDLCKSGKFNSDYGYDYICEDYFSSSAFKEK